MIVGSGTGSWVVEQNSEAVGTLRGLRCEFQIAEPPLRLAHLERLCRIRNDLRNRRVSVEHCEGAAISHRSQMLAQSGLQIRDSDVAHD